MNSTEFVIHWLCGCNLYCVVCSSSSIQPPSTRPRSHYRHQPPTFYPGQRNSLRGRVIIWGWRTRVLDGWRGRELENRHKSGKGIVLLQKSTESFPEFIKGRGGDNPVVGSSSFFNISSPVSCIASWLFISWSVYCFWCCCTLPLRLTISELIPPPPLRIWVWVWVLVLNCGPFLSPCRAVDWPCTIALWSAGWCSALAL